MTTVTFQTEDSPEGCRFLGLTVEGHSGYAPEGEDLLCASITSSLRLMECTLNDVLGLELPVQVEPELVRICLQIPSTLDSHQEGVCQALLAGLMLYLTELAEEYPDCITVLEV